MVQLGELALVSSTTTASGVAINIFRPMACFALDHSMRRHERPKPD
jgi:hypothetical protein